MTKGCVNPHTRTPPTRSEETNDAMCWLCSRTEFWTSVLMEQQAADTNSAVHLQTFSMAFNKRDHDGTGSRGYCKYSAHPSSSGWNELEVLSIFTSGRASRPRWKSARPSFRVVDDSCKRQRTIVNFRRRAYAAVKKSRAVSIRKAIVTHYSEQLNIFSQSSYKLSLVDKMQADNLPNWKEQCRWGGGGREGAERERKKKYI